MKEFPGEFEGFHGLDHDNIDDDKTELTHEEIAALIEKQQREGDIRIDERGLREELKRQGHPIVEDEN